MDNTMEGLRYYLFGSRTRLEVLERRFKRLLDRSTVQANPTLEHAVPSPLPRSLNPYWLACQQGQEQYQKSGRLDDLTITGCKVFWLHLQRLLRDRRLSEPDLHKLDLQLTLAKSHNFLVEVIEPRDLERELDRKVYQQSFDQA